MILAPLLTLLRAAICSAVIWASMPLGSRREPRSFLSSVTAYSTSSRRPLMEEGTSGTPLCSFSFWMRMSISRLSPLLATMSRAFAAVTSPAKPLREPPTAPRMAGVRYSSTAPARPASTRVTGSDWDTTSATLLTKGTTVVAALEAVAATVEVVEEMALTSTPVSAKTLPASFRLGRDFSAGATTSAVALVACCTMGATVSTPFWMTGAATS
mmetsp:Transcript_10651/g.22903  ORF Transcript_10651/g.22903 Transcript_10651/m.22903 type:complete len:213 (+) Transcript_10651:718-1356(+)